MMGGLPALYTLLSGKLLEGSEWRSCMIRSSFEMTTVGPCLEETVGKLLS